MNVGDSSGKGLRESFCESSAVAGVAGGSGPPNIYGGEGIDREVSHFLQGKIIVISF